MPQNFKYIISIIMIVAIFSVAINLMVGYTPLTFQDFFNSQSVNHPIAELRINRVLAMLLVGISLPTSGFLMQEYFQNPLAGPSVLGISSVASLAVAVCIFFITDYSFPEFLQNSLISIAAIMGSVALMIILLIISNRFRDKTYLVIFGFLISALAGAIVSILQFYAENQSLKNYILWSFGANNQISRNQLWILGIITLISIMLSAKTIKPLIGNSLGTQYAQSLGINLNQLKYLVIITSSLFSASITAFLGPILFIGIIVPHFCRLIWNPSKLWHQWILNIFLGILILQIFSIISEVSLLPINIITSLFGVPVIFMMLLKQNKNVIS